ncbi:hypothetical protein C5167_045024 [Papaver somniferum]|uniref:Uncharacterized protein n=1 Tax=Papaver somniferum TaxID=3469 RepID=A0A4Y7LD85_PAPSO|nr:hypothetical protein C5167_045024 [Papaver somniferum]
MPNVVICATGNEKFNNYWEAELSQENVQESAPWTRYEISQLSAGYWDPAAPIWSLLSELQVLIEQSCKIMKIMIA